MQEKTNKTHKNQKNTHKRSLAKNILLGFISVIFVVSLYFYYSPFDKTYTKNAPTIKLEKLPPQPKITRKDVQSINENVEKKAQEAEIKHEERQKKGDTIAINDKKLAEYLPKNPQGFTKTNKSTQNPYNMSGQKFANAEQEYKKGNAFLRINLIDYNAGNSPDIITSAYWTKSLGTENDNERSAGFTLKNKMRGWEVFFKRKKMAEITIAISDRFTLILKANQQTDCETLKKIAEDMQTQLDELGKK